MDTVLKQLQSTGHKLTSSRREILGVINSTPTSAQEVYEVLQQKSIKTDLVTVYRTLEMLTYHGIARKTQFKDKIARFELVTDDDHHHHLVCENCGVIEDIPLDEEAIVKQVEMQTKFKVKNHNLEFFGLCYECQN